MYDRALHSLWPNGVHCLLPHDRHTITHAHIREEVDLINIEIQNLCASKVFTVPSFEGLAMGWKYINECHIPWLTSD